MNPAACHFAKREVAVRSRAMTVRNTLIDLAVMLGVGVVLALLGPFGSFAAPFAMRLLYWLMLTVGGYFLFMPVVRGADALAARLQLPPASLWAAGCIAASMPMTAVVWYANGLWANRTPPTLDEAAALYGDVLIVSGLVCLILWFLSAHRRRVPDPPVVMTEPLPVAEPPATAAGPKLFERLPLHLGRDLIALEMEDHYVRAHTTTGSALLLLRMRDAVAELDGVAGAQVHRSWWVAREAVTGTVRDGRNVRLRLANGLEAPVARAIAPELRAAGWW